MRLADKPFLRKVTLRLPRMLWPIPEPYGHVFAFTEDGRIVADLQDPSGAYPETTGVTETGGRLYIQSLHAHNLGWLPKTAAPDTISGRARVAGHAIRCNLSQKSNQPMAYRGT